MPQETIGELIEMAIALERGAEAFYLELAQLFSHHPDVAVFWEQYAKEETGHALWLEKLQQRLSDEKLAQPASSQMVTSAQRLLQLSPEKMLQSVKTLEDAYQLAHDLEHSETNAIFEFLIADFAIAEQAYPFLRSQLKEHIDRITTEFPRPFQDKVVRLAIKANRPA
ncbi:MAG: hypothetical protein JW900_11910 [Anaerolineae bacterium]|nr:hypothetical protein [Anaerolineae bacterium]